jgi:hypothetical protein
MIQDYVFFLTNGGSMGHCTFSELYNNNKLELKWVEYVKLKYGLCLIDICINNLKEVDIELTDLNKDLYDIKINDTESGLDKQLLNIISVEKDNCLKRYVKLFYKEGLVFDSAVGPLITFIAHLSIIKICKKKLSYSENSKTLGVPNQEFSNRKTIDDTFSFKYYAGRSAGDFMSLGVILHDQSDKFIEDWIDMIFYMGCFVNYYNGNKYYITSTLLRNNPLINDKEIKNIVNCIKTEIIKYKDYDTWNVADTTSNNEKQIRNIEIDRVNIDVCMKMIKDSLYVISGKALSLEILSYIINNEYLKDIDLNNIEELTQYTNKCIKEYIELNGTNINGIKNSKYTSRVPIDTPWHLSIYRNIIHVLREKYYTFFNKHTIDFDLIINKYISSSIAIPFNPTIEFCINSNKILDSEVLQNIINNWDSYEGKEYNRNCFILIEILISQFYLPNNWIGTMEYILNENKNITLVEGGLLKKYSSWLYKDTSYNLMHANDFIYEN